MTTTAATYSSHPSEDINNNVNSLSLGQALDYCLDILKIKENSEFYRNISAEFMSQTKVPLAMIKTHGNWITAMKLIADCSGMLNYMEECWKQGKDDLLVSRYYPRFTNLKAAIPDYYRTKRFNFNIVKYLIIT